MEWWPLQRRCAAAVGSTGMTTAIERKPDDLRLEADGAAQKLAEIIASEMDGARFVGSTREKGRICSGMRLLKLSQQVASVEC